MKFTVDVRDDIVLVGFSGSMAYGDFAGVGQRCRQWLDEGRRLFVLDFRALPYVDSTALAEVVACVKRARERAGNVAVVATPGGKVEAVLRITGIDRVVGLFADPEQAAAELRSATSV